MAETTDTIIPGLRHVFTIQRIKLNPLNRHVNLKSATACSKVSKSANRHIDSGVCFLPIQQVLKLQYLVCLLKLLLQSLERKRQIVFCVPGQREASVLGLWFSRVSNKRSEEVLMGGGLRLCVTCTKDCVASHLSDPSSLKMRVLSEISCVIWWTRHRSRREQSVILN